VQPGRELLQTVGRGYRLAIPPAAVDVHRFEHAVAAAEQATSPLDRAQALQMALMLWSDTAGALSDVDLPFAEVERIRLDELAQVDTAEDAAHAEDDPDREPGG
jgi:DNA-binding SARP family transcriptional activator